MPEYLGMAIRDLNRKCVGSVFTYGDSGEFFRLENVCEQGDADRGKEVKIYIPDFSNNTWERKYVGYDVFDNTSTIFPRVGYVNYGKSSYHLSRLASRQWHVGYNSNIVHTRDMFDEERTVVGLKLSENVVYDVNFLKEVFNRQYPSYEEAVAAVVGQQVLSRAFSPYLSISQSLQYDRPVLTYKNRLVGFIQDNLTPVIFSPAEYVEKIMPVPTDIKEVTDCAAFRSKWY